MTMPATRMDSFMTRIAGSMAQYLRSPTVHPDWEPPAEYDGARSWGADDMERLRGMHIPCVPSRGAFNLPDMLLYSLGSLEKLDASFPERLAELVAEQKHIYVSNASGTGKTRLLFEVLAAHWGLYFSCSSDAVIDPYGSLDLTSALDTISTTRVGAAPLYHTIPFTNIVPRSARPRIIHNRQVAHLCVKRVILARLMIFKLYCEALADVVLPESTARMKWLLLQLRPHLLLSTDVFWGLEAFLGDLDDAIITQRISTLYDATKSKIAFVAIDETNVALQKYPAMFASSNYRRLVSVFRELVACMATHHPESRLIIAGTELDMELARDAVRSSASSFRSVVLFHSLGHFATLARNAVYLKHFLGGDISDALIHTAHTWLHGRHRFLAVFVMYTLLYGLHRAVPVLDTIIHAFTEYRRPGCELVRKTSLRVGFPNARLEASPLALRLRHAALNFLHHRKSTTLTADAPAIVSLGVALYEGGAPYARFFEPLIFIGIARWLHQSERYGVHGVLRARLQDPMVPIQDASLAEGLAACFCNVLSSASNPPLRSFLHFSGPDPTFVRKPMKLLLPRLSQRRRAARFQSVRVSSEACLQVASSAEEVFGWFDDASRPFLIPDADCGVDLMFAAQLTGGRNVLVCVHTRPFHSGRSRRGARVVPPDPTDFYKSRPEARDRFLLYLALFQSPSTSMENDSRHSAVFRKYSSVHLLSFAEAYRSGESYDPPVATIDFNYLIQQARPTEFVLSQAETSITELAPEM